MRSRLLSILAAATVLAVFFESADGLCGAVAVGAVAEVAVVAAVREARGGGSMSRPSGGGVAPSGSSGVSRPSGGASYRVHPAAAAVSRGPRRTFRSSSPPAGRAVDACHRLRSTRPSGGERPSGGGERLAASVAAIAPARRIDLPSLAPAARACQTRPAGGVAERPSQKPARPAAADRPGGGADRIVPSQLPA